MGKYRFGSVDEAIKCLQNLKSNGKNAQAIIFTIDFDDGSTTKSIILPDDSCVLVEKSQTIILNDDEYLSHMQLYSIKQFDLENIKREGKMHDIIFQ